jgi:hypothetical protein
MNVELTDERILVLADRFSMEQAEGRAWTKRIEAFGTLARVGGLFKQPKDEDFEVAYRERRLQPFWRLSARTVLGYERRRDYAVAVAPMVQSVVIGGETLSAAGGQIKVSGLETCREESRRELYVDGLSKAVQPTLADYLKHASSEATAETLADATRDGVVVVPSEARASTLVRDLIAASIGRIEADTVLEETVRVEAIELYYRPVYAFRYRWQGKEAVVEFDAVTGEPKAGGATFERYLGKMLDPAFLLDVGAEAANMFIPGANLAKMAIVKGIELAKR